MFVSIRPLETLDLAAALREVEKQRFLWELCRSWELLPVTVFRYLWD